MDLIRIKRDKSKPRTVTVYVDYGGASLTHLNMLVEEANSYAEGFNDALECVGYARVKITRTVER